MSLLILRVTQWTISSHHPIGVFTLVMIFDELCYICCLILTSLIKRISFLENMDVDDSHYAVNSIVMKYPNSLSHFTFQPSAAIFVAITSLKVTMSCLVSGI